eukprot:2380762-Rhodomonas_salina.1
MRRQSPAWVEKRICCRCWSKRVGLAAVLGGALARAARLARIMVGVKQGGEKSLRPISSFFSPGTPPRARPWDVTGARWRSADTLERTRVENRKGESVDKGRWQHADGAGRKPAEAKAASVASTHAGSIAKQGPGQAAARHDKGCQAGRVKRHDGCGDVLFQSCPRCEQSGAPAA